MRYVRGGAQDTSNSVRVDAQSNNDYVREDAQDEYIAPTAPCWQCTRLVQWDDEIEGFPCKK